MKNITGTTAYKEEQVVSYIVTVVKSRFHHNVTSCIT